MSMYKTKRKQSIEQISKWEVFSTIITRKFCCMPYLVIIAIKNNIQTKQTSNAENFHSDYEKKSMKNILFYFLNWVSM